MTRPLELRRLVERVRRAGAHVLVLTPEALAALEGEPAWPAVRDELEALGVAVRMVAPEGS